MHSIFVVGYSVILGEQMLGPLIKSAIVLATLQSCSGETIFSSTSLSWLFYGSLYLGGAWFSFACFSRLNRILKLKDIEALSLSLWHQKCAHTKSGILLRVFNVDPTEISSCIDKKFVSHLSKLIERYRRDKEADLEALRCYLQNELS